MRSLFKKPTTILIICIYAQKAEAGPPLGTILGNLGINATKFAKDFNEHTKDLPEYFKVVTHITVLENKSYYFDIFKPTTGYILSLLKYERTIIINSKKSITKYFVDKNEVAKLAKLKYPYLPVKKSMAIIMGSVYSADLTLE